ncbi:diguanylate cyclase [Clostridium sp. MB40-C1]|uniref:sensor domain-containing diguanylate cyclase n=1 Tax=Clostridium sp. MB40-C1 TaxID=3070996 RepID=UPI0027E01404|nr:diguanylate cyclase [Clostridium sp. MB40-C1]WMJ79192.1 diguanylate cyclase [Clostridium sp. MB40-C1]
MKLYERIFKASLFIFLTSILILFIASHGIFLKRATDLEVNEVSQNANSILNLINKEIQTMSFTNLEYSNWDKTYEFMQDHNKDYIKSNFSTIDTFKRQQICFLAFIDNNRKILYSDIPYENLDIFYGSSININNKIISQINSLDISKSITGIIVIDNIPFLINCHPIIKENSNLSRGAFLLVKPLKSTNIEYLYENLSLNTEVLKPVKFDYKRENNIFVNIKNKHILEEYILIKDIFGKDALSINLSINRGIYNTVENSVYMYMILLFFVVFLSSYLFFIFLNKIILKRVMNIRNVVMEIKNTQNFSLRIKNASQNEDEIAELNREFNNLLNVLENSQNQLIYMVYHDPLTGIANRKRIMQILNELSEDPKNKFALFYIDLNDFKGINDNFGHHCGDFVLKEISKIVKNVLDKNCILGRLSGDEFVIIQKNIHSLEDAESLAIKICNALETPMEYNTNTIHPSISIGISIYPDHTEDIRTLLDYADFTMYIAKKEKGNSYKIYSNEQT